jgi:hypothetical protein
MEVVPYRTQPVAVDAAVRQRGRAGAMLLTFGVVLICLGAICGLFALLILLGTLIASAPRSSALPSATVLAAHVLPPTLVFAAIATGLIWTGIGSIRLRRWSRSIVLAFSGFVLFVSGLTAAQYVLRWAMSPFMASPSAPPQVRARNSPAAAMQAEQEMAEMIGLALLVLIGVVLPLLLFLVYRRQDIAEALVEADPDPPWTDRVPLPVLGLCVALLCVALLETASVPAAVLPLFDIDLSPALRMIAQVVIAALFFVAALEVYRQSELGVWLTIGLIVVLSAAFSFAALSASMSAASQASTQWNWLGQSQYVQVVQSASVNGIIGVMIYTIPAVLYVLYARRAMQRGNR